jgi:voltage-gated potassium channel Kch
VTLLAMLLGAGLIFVALRDIFDTLFHPSERGKVCGAVMRITWRGFRWFAVRRPKGLGAIELAGLGALLAVILSWSALLAVGWALVLWPHLPDGFLFATGLDPSNERGFVDALYLSLVTLTTLGYGDIVPTSGWLRALVPLEALVGFGLLTASISWVLSLYPALSRQRSLAHEISVMREAGLKTGIGLRQMDAETAGQVLKELTSQLINVRADFSQFPITYYFHSSDERFALSAAMPYLVRLAEKGGSADCPPAVRLRAAALREAIDDFSTTVASRFLGLSSAPTDEVLAAYARDHLHASNEEADVVHG